MSDMDFSRSIGTKRATFIRYRKKYGIKKLGIWGSSMRHF